jgi:hypothetical protein
MRSLGAKPLCVRSADALGGAGDDRKATVVAAGYNTPSRSWRRSAIRLLMGMLADVHT